MIKADNMKFYQIAGFTVGISEYMLEKSSDLSLGLKIFSIKDPERLDIVLKQEEREPDNSEKKLLFGSSECTYPTFLYRLNSGDYECKFRQPDEMTGLSFYIPSDWTQIILTEDDTKDNGYMLFNRLGALFNLAVLNFNACVFHGVVMKYKDAGILVMAPAGTGKSTHTDMWEKKEHALIINGDRCLCRCINGVWYAYGMPWAGSSKKILNMSTKIHAIVMLERDNENHVLKMSPFNSELSLLQRMFAPVSKGILQEKAFEYARDIALKIPVFKLVCRPDYEAVDVLKEAIQKWNYSSRFKGDQNHEI